MENVKKAWQAPGLELLDINDTMQGKGWKVIDWVDYDDADLYNPS